MYRQMLRLLSKVATKLIMYDGSYFRKKLLLQSVVVGPSDRVHLGIETDLQNAILNTNSGSIYIGDFSFCGHDCMILTGTHSAKLRDRDRQQRHPTSGNDIHIGKGVWIGSGAIILGGVSIGDNAVIGAGAIVTRDCLGNRFYAGIPAEAIDRNRNSVD